MLYSDTPVRPKMLNQSCRKMPLLGRETLCRCGNREHFHLEKHEEVQEAAVGFGCPRVCSQQVPPREASGKKSNRPAVQAEHSPAARGDPSRGQSWRPRRKETPEVLGGVGRVPRLQMMV